MNLKNPDHAGTRAGWVVAPPAPSRTPAPHDGCIAPHCAPPPAGGCRSHTSFHAWRLCLLLPPISAGEAQIYQALLRVLTRNIILDTNLEDWNTKRKTTSRNKHLNTKMWNKIINSIDPNLIRRHSSKCSTT